MYRFLTSRNSFLRFIICGALLSALTACPPKRSAPPPPPPPQYLTHVVKYPGETLSIIAGWYTGQAKNWSAILDSNPGLNPKRIRIGDIVQIPMQLVVKETPLPKSALGGARTSKPSERSEPEIAQPEDSIQQDEASPASDSAEPAPSMEIIPEPSAPSVDSTMEEPAIDSQPPQENQPDAIEPAPVAPSATQEGESPAQDSATKPVPREQIKIKTRDELLKELLEE